MFENFKRLNLTIGTPSVSVTENGVAFSKSAIIKMGKPENVILMIDEEGKQIAIQACGEDEADATPFLKNKKNVSVRWNNKDLLATISTMMSWDLKEQGYKSEGQFYSSENAMIFDFKKATAIIGADKSNDD